MLYKTMGLELFRSPSFDSNLMLQHDVAAEKPAFLKLFDMHPKSQTTSIADSFSTAIKHCDLWNFVIGNPQFICPKIK